MSIENNFANFNQPKNPNEDIVLECLKAKFLTSFKYQKERELAAQNLDGLTFGQFAEMYKIERGDELDEEVVYGGSEFYKKRFGIPENIDLNPTQKKEWEKMVRMVIAKYGLSLDERITFPEPEI